jgi:hypothetical protein
MGTFRAGQETTMAASRHGIALAWLVAAGLAGCGAEAPPVPADVARPSAFSPELRASAVATTDVEAMLDALARIEGWHRREGTGAVATLRAGASKAQLDALEAALGCALPMEARALWRWRDGQETAGDADPLVWYHGLLPIERVLADVRDLRAADRAGWDPRWVPVLYFEQEWYFVECAPTRRAASPLGLYFAEDDPKPAYASLTALFATHAEAMAAGAVTVADDGALGGQPRALRDIHARHNPGIPFPYHVP